MSTAYWGARVGKSLLPAVCFRDVTIVLSMLQDPQSVKACGVLAQSAGHEFSKCVLLRCGVLKRLTHSNMQVTLKEFLVVRIINVGRVAQ
jgi:hypothetical protein